MKKTMTDRLLFFANLLSNFVSLMFHFRCQARLKEWQTEKLVTSVNSLTSHVECSSKNVCLIHHLMQLHKPVASNTYQHILIRIICCERWLALDEFGSWMRKIMMLCLILLILIASWIMQCPENCCMKHIFS